MKQLTKVKLINWHRFENETIPIARSVLLSGENGAGKSTILDAIQFVITCSKNHFNKAAHEKGKRNLNGYIRCKTGKEDHPYERTGELSAHIALEFYEESRKQYFIVGAVMDSSTEEREPNCAWYLIDRERIEDKFFLSGTIPKSISSFRNTNKKIKQFMTTQTEAKKMIQSRFGRLEDKFFSLIPKALAFKPIHDIKDFVYSYVLDEKEVNIDVLKENVRSYQDLERILLGVRTRMDKLEKIQEKYGIVEGCLKKDKIYAYYLARAFWESAADAIQRAEGNINFYKLQLEENKKKRRENQALYEQKSETLLNLTVELESNEEYRAISTLEQELKQLEEQIKQDEENHRELKKSMRKALEDANKLLEIKDIAPCITAYVNFLKDPGQIEGTASAVHCVDQAIQYKKEMFRKIQEKSAAISVQLHGKRQELSELKNKIRKLEEKKLSYPPSVAILLEKLQLQFERLDRSGRPRVLCELLEITNPAWSHAVEGYLNTQRFYILVEPEDFDLALSVYEKARENKQAFGVGLINTGKLEGYDEANPDSLASVVTSKSIWAKRYINMVLGRVHMCKSYQELKKHEVSITRQCMKYQNHVVSAIRPDIYETPYIGGEAYKVQLAECKKQELITEREFSKLDQQLSALSRLSGAFDQQWDVDIKYRLPVLEEMRSHKKRLELCNLEIQKIKKNSTLIQKQIFLSEVKQEARTLLEQVQYLDRKYGEIENKISSTKESLSELQRKESGNRLLLSQSQHQMGEELAFYDKEYEKQLEGKVIEKFIENFDRTRKANSTIKEAAEKQLTEVMREYKIAHDFGAPDTLEGYIQYQEEYQKLKDSELLSFEEKVYQAKTAAEQEFQEQFLSKMQENIRQAQGEFKELNKALKEIHFSHEQYEFAHEASRKYAKYYQMFMDDLNSMEGTSIFSGLFHEKHKEVIDELFDKLLGEDENSTKVLEEFTDYRTYMDYDIRITGEDGSYMWYSKVSQEKSGGETQTPFYITVAASFMQLYRNGIGGDSVGLVMFDEAFNNMDDERIQGVMEFMTNTSLQLIIAAPPDKIQYIGPMVSQTLLVLTEQNTSFIEEYYHGTL